MSESYVINEKRELILDRVKEFIYQNGGVVKKSQLNELGIDYRRILDFVEKGDLIRIKNGYYAVRLSDFSEEELIARLFPDCVLNLETALYAYGYLNQSPTDTNCRWTRTRPSRGLSWIFRRWCRCMRSRRH